MLAPLLINNAWSFWGDIAADFPMPSPTMYTPYNVGVLSASFGSFDGTFVGFTGTGGTLSASFPVFSASMDVVGYVLPPSSGTGERPRHRLQRAPQRRVAPQRR